MVNHSGKSRDEWITLYMSFMDKVKREGKDEFIKWLINDTDFFDAPASGRFHCNYQHGLIEHSMNVFNYAKNLYIFSKKNYPDYQTIASESIIISTLHHDICKINFYGKEKSWVKHDYKWIDYETYKAGVNDDFPIGHGEKSVIEMLRHGFTDLTEQEMLAIRHHMGNYGADTISVDIAMKDPLVKLVHISDLAVGLVEPTINYKDLALQKHINLLNR
jgi:hypothetical protein